MVWGNLRVIKLVVLLSLCLASEALFAASEMALVASDELKLKAQSEAGDRRARRLLELLARRDQLLALTLTGANLSTILSATLLTFYLHRLGAGKALYAPVLLTPLVLVFGEALPKLLSLRYPVEFGKAMARPLHLLATVAMPLLWLETWFSKSLRRLAGVAQEARSVFLTREDLAFLVGRESAESGVDVDAIQPAERQIIRRFLRFGRLEARNAMVPLVRVEAVSKDATVREAIEIVRREGFSRLPVYDGHIVDIVGVIHVFDLLEVPSLDVVIGEVMRPVSYVSESTPLSEVWALLQRTGENLAVVVDEHGGATGIVTMEDLLEEIVGEIEDEYDVREEHIRIVNSRQIAVSGQTQISELNERFGLRLPESSDYITLAGLVIQRLGHIPRVGERIRVDGIVIDVVLSDARSVQELMLTLPYPIRPETGGRR